MNAPIKKLADVLKAGTEYLAERNIEHPRLICELLAARLLNCKRLDLYLQFEAVISAKQLDAMRRGVVRAGKGEPIQYILKQTEFYGRSFKTDSRALIPRPETETLVEKVLAEKKIWSIETGRPLVVDVGTGTGCIVLTLASECPNADYVAIDTSADAIELARENAVALGLQDSVTLRHGELPEYVEAESARAIVANLPYIPTDICEQLPMNVRNYEPRQALDGGPDGLSVINVIAQDAACALQSGGMLFLEIGEDQGAAVTEILAANGFSDVTVEQDLNKRDRIAKATMS
ncbi:MAG: peptide chain release factor N(5)-glutamine methyltransferase [Lentisphaerae bacterium]|nr:peptide chain release factor N(5)-glutamine methyltransferase [Lentisphaerota bacterium]